MNARGRNGYFEPAKVHRSAKIGGQFMLTVWSKNHKQTKTAPIILTFDDDELEKLIRVLSTKPRASCTWDIVRKGVIKVEKDIGKAL